MLLLLSYFLFIIYYQHAAHTTPKGVTTPKEVTEFVVHTELPVIFILYSFTPSPVKGIVPNAFI